MREPLNAQSQARKAEGHPHTFQPQHAWVTGNDCATFRGRTQQHPPCGMCTKVQGGAGPHASWDCPLRYWKVYGTCPGFLRDGSRDPSQWQGDNMARSAKLEWACLTHNWMARFENFLLHLHNKISRLRKKFSGLVVFNLF